MTFPHAGMHDAYAVGRPPLIAAARSGRPSPGHDHRVARPAPLRLCGCWPRALAKTLDADKSQAPEHASQHPAEPRWSLSRPRQVVALDPSLVQLPSATRTSSDRARLRLLTCTDWHPSGDIPARWHGMGHSPIARSRLRPLDWFLLATWPFAALLISVAMTSIPIEETHEVGNDAPMDRWAIAICIVWIVLSAVVVVLRTSPGGLRAQFRRERQQWKETRALRKGEEPDSLW